MAPGVYQRAAAGERVARGDRVVGAHGAAGVAGLVDGRQHVDRGAGIGAEVVPLVRARPGRGQAAGRGVGAVSTSTWLAGSQGSLK